LLGYILPLLNIKTYTWYTGWGVTKKLQSHAIKFMFSKNTYVNIDICCVCALCPLLIHILLYNSCGILGTNIVSCWVGVAGALAPSWNAADPQNRASCGSILGFVCWFVCWNKTRKTIFRLLLGEKIVVQKCTHSLRKVKHWTAYPFRVNIERGKSMG